MKDQRIRIGKNMQKIAGDVTSADRTACVKKFKISYVTVSNYLKGGVTNNDLGLEMIAFFKERIAVRETKLKSLCQS